MKNTQGCQSEFSPIIIVGAPRSGTTMLAVLLNRHSKIAIPPETQFFTDFVRENVNRHAGRNRSRHEMVSDALSHARIADLGLSADEVLAFYSNYVNSYPNLFRAIIESYAARYRKDRSGEKSPKHLQNVAEIVSNFPDAKVICVVRDGRDVVRSLLKTSWAEPGNRRRFGLFCMEWSDYARTAIALKGSLSEENFKIVKYESILMFGEKQLQEICAFIGEEFESGMLEVGERSGVVPDWEGEWKNKAEKTLDPGRAYAWRTLGLDKDVWKMNTFMRRELKLHGYDDTGMRQCPLHLRIVYLLNKVPYFAAMRPLSLRGLKLVRKLKKAVG